MLNFVNENRAPFLAVLLLVVFLLLLSVQIRTPEASAASALETVVLAALSPVLRVSAGASDGVRGLWRGYVDLRHLHRENERLHREIATLRLEHQRLQESGRDVSRLHELLDLKEALTLPTVAARVIRIDVDTPFRIAIMDRGAVDGVQAGDAVITPAGVVGRVTEAAPHVSRVQLLVDTSSGAAAMVSRTREQGMVVGRHADELELQYLSALARVKAGDAINTSGLDGIYPKGLRIGRVLGVTTRDRLQQRLAVATAVDFRRLEEVLILVRQRPPAVGAEARVEGAGATR